MPIQRPFLLYLRSRLNLVLSLVSAGLVIVSLAFLRPHAGIPVLVVLIAYAAVTATLFFSRVGAKEIVAEIDQDRTAKIRGKIEEMARTRDRISVLRIGDPRMAKAIELFLQESASYLEKCRELNSYSPLANERIERVLEICQVFLGERDESATARRYELSKPAGAPTDQAEMLANDIQDCAGVIRSRVTEDLLGLSGKERLAIMKELEEKK